MQLQKATRKKVKLRLGLSGASGFGKTFSALLIAKGLVGDWSKIAVIDTENDSASLYSHLGDFNTLSLTQPFTPERYVEAINACIKAGMEAIIIDSISHEWDGKGGCLQIVESLGGRYQDWGKVTPRHQAFIDAITNSPVHMVTTVRRKQDYEMTKDNNGKMKVEKAGLKEVTRDGYEYELTLNLELINDQHLAKASKDRTGLFMNKAEFIVTEETGRIIKEWTESGAEPLLDDVPTKEERLMLMSLVNLSDMNQDEKEAAIEAINTCGNYKRFEQIQHKLEARRMPIGNIQNPSQADINAHVLSIAK